MISSRDRWDAVDTYLGALAPHDEALDEALRGSDAAGLPQIAVSQVQGKLLNLFARMVGARRILEIGTLGGYSTIWLARALPPDGRLITLELDPHHANVARDNLRRAGLADRVEVRVGPALDTLAQLVAESAAPFDFLFIDADKANCAPYVERALPLLRAGSAIVVDNVVRDGHVIDESGTDESVVGVRALIALLATHPRLDATALQTVGLKGHDGFALALVGA